MPEINARAKAGDTSTVGLFPKDSFLRYVDDEICVLDNPHTGTPTLVFRRPHSALARDEKMRRAYRVLRLIRMQLAGTHYVREDGLFCLEVKPNP